MLSFDPKVALSQGLQQLKLEMPPAKQAQLLAFLALLSKWNKAHNLTAIRDLPKMITHHLLDSLAIAPYYEGQRLLDVGSGAGFPGIPLALFFSTKSVVLLDSQQKKTGFLTQAKAQLNLENVEVVCARVEEYHHSLPFDTIIARAFGTITDIVQHTERLLCANGRWLIMKGRYPTDELKGLTLPYSVNKLVIPGLQAERHLVVINKIKGASSE